MRVIYRDIRVPLEALEAPGLDVQEVLAQRAKAIEEAQTRGLLALFLGSEVSTWSPWARSTVSLQISTKEVK